MTLHKLSDLTEMPSLRLSRSELTPSKMVVRSSRSRLPPWRTNSGWRTSSPWSPWASWVSSSLAFFTGNFSWTPDLHRRLTTCRHHLPLPLHQRQVQVVLMPEVNPKYFVTNFMQRCEFYKFRWKKYLRRINSSEGSFLTQAIPIVKGEHTKLLMAVWPDG